VATVYAYIDKNGMGIVRIMRARSFTVLIETVRW